eukprot:2190645-Pleurochrysis_carterae.AAC.5
MLLDEFSRLTLPFLPHAFAPPGRRHARREDADLREHARAAATGTPARVKARAPHGVVEFSLTHTLSLLPPSFSPSLSLSASWMRARGRAPTHGHARAHTQPSTNVHTRAGGP